MEGRILPMARLISHGLALFAIVLAPWLSRILYQRVRQAIEAGDARARIRLYRVILATQVLTTAIVLGLWVLGGISRTSLGLGAPRSWWLSQGLAIVSGGLLLWSGWKLRARSGKIRSELQHAEAILPMTARESRWFAAISIGAGIDEELMFRGFLFYYFTLWFPHINPLENALLTSAIFGFGHLYQGTKGVLSTGVTGLILAGLFLLSGNLLLPMVVHALGDLRAAIVFWPQEQSPGGGAVEAA
jgi:uncharacterized protein